MTTTRRNTRKNLCKIAEDTLQCLQQGSYTLVDGITSHNFAQLQQEAEEQTILYTPKATDILLSSSLSSQPSLLISEQTHFEVTNESTLEAIFRIIDKGMDVDVVALNFASAKNPGGGFLGGSQAQEESLARSTGLYPCLLKVPDYYTTNRKTAKSGIYTDHIIYSPQVPLIKDDDGNYRPTLQLASFITAPAVNMGVVLKQEAESVHKVAAIMKRRIAKVLAVALNHGHQHLVLGAWGCGVFRNDPISVAKYFKEVIDRRFKNCFATVVFAIYGNEERFLQPFRQLFCSDEGTRADQVGYIGVS